MSKYSFFFIPKEMLNFIQDDLLHRYVKSLGLCEISSTPKLKRLWERRDGVKKNGRRCPPSSLPACTRLRMSARARLYAGGRGIFRRTVSFFHYKFLNTVLPVLAESIIEPGKKSLN